MFLQLALLSFAVQWIGSPWQMGIGKALLACIFFIAVIIISALPSLFREWGNIKGALLINIIIQIVVLILSVLIPGIGQILALAFNIYLLFRPVSFYKNIGFGFILFFLWLIGLNNILGLFLLTDPRGVLTGDLYFSVTDFVLFAVFLAALVRAVYHAVISSRQMNRQKLLTEEAQASNAELQKKEKKTMIPLFFISLALITISIFIPLPWQKQAKNDLSAGFNAIAQSNFDTAKIIAGKYYNEIKILYNGDVFYLNAMVNEDSNPIEAVYFYNKAASWYDNHKSWISEDFHSEAYYRLSLMYISLDPPDYYKATNSIDKAIKVNPENERYHALQTQIKEQKTKFEEQEKIGFFKRIWNRVKARF